MFFNIEPIVEQQLVLLLEPFAAQQWHLLPCYKNYYLGALLDDRQQ